VLRRWTGLPIDVGSGKVSTHTFVSNLDHCGTHLRDLAMDEWTIADACDIFHWLLFNSENSLLQNRSFVPVGKSLLSRFPNRDRQSGTKGLFVSCQATGTNEGHPYQPGPKALFFPVSFGLFLLHFRLNFVL